MTMVSAASRQSFESFKIKMDDALRTSFASQVLRVMWQGRTLALSGPGCRAFGTFAAGYFTGFVELSGPGLFMRRAILADLDRMLRAAGCVDILLRDPVPPGSMAG